MTVKQIDGATQGGPSDPYKIDEVEVTNVRIVGKIEDISDDASSCNFLLCDGTGKVQLKKYTDGSSEWLKERGLWTLVYMLKRAVND